MSSRDVKSARKLDYDANDMDENGKAEPLSIGKAAVKRILGDPIALDDSPAAEAVSTAKVTLLVGSAYTQGGEAHPYGHVALRIVDGTKDITYDYGRYGKTWGFGGSEGEGMLRVWTNFNSYIADENATTRTTTGYTFDTTAQGVALIEHFFAQKTKSVQPVVTRPGMTQYRIADDYDGLKSNCTTISLAAAELALPHVDDNHGKYDDGRGLSFSERTAAHIKGWPDTTFLPADLGAELDAMKGTDSAPAVKTYKQRG